MPNIVHCSDPTSIEPRTIYALPEYIRVSGISKTRIQLAKKAGIELRTLKVGKRVFVRGSDGIKFIEQLAAQHSEQTN